MLKESGAKKEEKDSLSIKSESNDKEIKDMFIENGVAVEARYSKRYSAEGVDLMVPCYVSSEDRKRKDLGEECAMEDGETRDLMIEHRPLEGAAGDEADEGIVIDGKIVEEDENLCIILECERGEDVETAGRAIQAALQEEGINTNLKIPHGSYALKPLQTSNHTIHHHRTTEVCTQATQTEDT